MLLTTAAATVEGPSVVGTESSRRETPSPGADSLVRRSSAAWTTALPRRESTHLLQAASHARRPAARSRDARARKLIQHQAMTLVEGGASTPSTVGLGRYVLSAHGYWNSGRSTSVSNSCTARCAWSNAAWVRHTAAASELAIVMRPKRLRPRTQGASS